MSLNIKETTKLYVQTIFNICYVENSETQKFQNLKNGPLFFKWKNLAFISVGKTA